MTATLPRITRRRSSAALAPVPDPAPVDPVERAITEAASLITRIKALEAELEPRRDFLLRHLQQHGLSMVAQGDVQVHRKVRHKWTYSSATERDALALRTAQKWEQSQGIATDDPTVYIAITFAKS